MKNLNNIDMIVMTIEYDVISEGDLEIISSIYQLLDKFNLKERLGILFTKANIDLLENT